MCQGVSNEFSLLMKNMQLTLALSHKRKLIWEMKMHEGKKDGRRFKTKKKKEKVKELTFSVVAKHLIVRQSSCAASNVSQRGLMENARLLHLGARPF